MKLSVCFLLCCATLCVRATDNNSASASAVPETSTDGICGRAVEMVLQKLEHIDRKLLELQFEIREFREQASNDKMPQEKPVPTTSQMTTAVTITATTSIPRTTATISQPTTTLNPKLSFYTSCRNVTAIVFWVFFILVLTTGARFKVYCEMEQFGGGWIVIQHRFNGLVDFYQNWDQYRAGFGVVDSEFWLGLERIHQITMARAHEVVIEMRDFFGNYGYSRYDAFQVGSESEQYILKTLGSYSGTAGDSMSQLDRGSKFSTKDRDNDPVSSGHFAAMDEGAWWYGSSNSATLNGPYKNVTESYKSIVWRSFKNDVRGLSFTRMMIREL
uniref:Putative ficolin n=1 Tax=Anopheles darlingi TaxID=43151 RepID=A0A2M4DQS9_ANODA